MGISSHFCNLFLFIVSVMLVTSNAEDVCVMKNACSCVFPNGTGFDMSPVTPQFYPAETFLDISNGTQYELSVYFFHPCSDATLSTANNSSHSTCVIPLSLCRHVTTMDYNKITGQYQTTGDVYDYLGSTAAVKFQPDGRTITYQNGPSKNNATVKKISTDVHLVCTTSGDRLLIDSLTEPSAIQLSFYSKDACLKQLEVGRSLGSTLLIIFFSFVVFYLVLGVCTKKFLMGATGVEVIPNLGFWTDLPNLVRDGWAFALNGFKLPARGPGPNTTPDPNSYDSI